jgi:hypothetical protein
MSKAPIFALKYFSDAVFQNDKIDTTDLCILYGTVPAMRVEV